MRDIRNKFIISIVDDNGIKQFSIHKLAKKVVLYILLFVLISAIVVFFTINLLANELKELQSRKDTTLEKYAAVYTENEQLKQQIEISQNKLAEINRKMQDLEEIVKPQENSEGHYSAPFDTQNLSQSQKSTILQILPNARPFEMEARALDFKSGVQFEIPANTEIYATADGIVDLTRNEDTKGIGKFVKIVHSFGFTSIYGQLSKVIVKRGDIVQKGQIIGYSGTNASKDRLYYDIRFLGSEVKIEDFLAWNLDNFEDIMAQKSSVDWNTLLWTIDDMMNINQHKILHDNTLSAFNAR